MVAESFHVYIVKRTKLQTSHILTYRKVLNIYDKFDFGKLNLK
jgi:hypothetical protein